MKKLFSLFFALTIGVGMASAQSGQCGANLTWEFSNGVLTISGTGEMEEYASNSDVPWYDYLQSIQSIIINDGVTNIGDEAFNSCTSLTSVSIPASVTNIGEYAFQYCVQLSSITIGSGVTNIEEGAFSYCNTLSSVSIPNSLTNIGTYAFYECHSLSTINIPNSVTNIEDYAFYYCIALNSVSIPNSVSNIGTGAFLGCSSLKSVTIPESVKSLGVGATFQGCTALESVEWNAVNCIIEEDEKGRCYPPFNNLSNITNFTFGNNVTNIPNALCYELSGLSSITIPNSVTIIEEDAFYHCSSLTSVTISNSVTSIEGSAFMFCSSLRSVTIPNSVINIGLGAFFGCTSLTSVTIPESVKSLGKGATFQGCDALKSVEWNAVNCTIEQSEETYYYSPFYDLSNITNFTFGNKVTTIPEYLCCCLNGLTSVTIPSSVTDIGKMAFAECAQLSDISCYATNPPQASTCSFLPYSATLHVLCENKYAYMADPVWGNFKQIECISSDNVETDKITVTPAETEAKVTWPSVSDAANYELVIKDKEGNLVCTLVFNANGQLSSIAYYAPARQGAPAQTQAAGFSFTVTGLDSGTAYDLTLTSKDDSDNILQSETVSFTTTEEKEQTSLENATSIQGSDKGKLILRNGQVQILRNGKTYTMTGVEVR